MKEEIIARRNENKKNEFVSIVLEDGEIKMGMYLLEELGDAPYKKLIDFDKAPNGMAQKIKRQRLKAILEHYIDIEKPIMAKEKLLKKLGPDSNAIQIVNEILEEMKQKIQTNNKMVEKPREGIQLLKTKIEEYPLKDYSLVIQTENEKSEIVKINGLFEGKPFLMYLKGSVSEELWNKLEVFALSLIPEEEQEEFYQKYPTLKKQKDKNKGNGEIEQR